MFASVPIHFRRYQCHEWAPMNDHLDPTPIKSRDLPFDLKLTNVVTAGSVGLIITLVVAIFTAGGIYVSQENDRLSLHNEVAGLRVHLDEAAKGLAQQMHERDMARDQETRDAEGRRDAEMRGIYSRFDRLEARVDELSNRPWAQAPHPGHQ